MKTTREFLNAAKSKKGFTSDRQLAIWLDITHGALSHYQSGRRTIDDYAAAKIAEALGVPAIQVIAAANLEREKDEKRKEFWENFSRGMAGTAAVLLSLFSFLIEESKAYLSAAVYDSNHYAQSSHPSNQPAAGPRPSILSLKSPPAVSELPAKAGSFYAQTQIVLVRKVPH